MEEVRNVDLQIQDKVFCAFPVLVKKAFWGEHKKLQEDFLSASLGRFDGGVLLLSYRCRLIIAGGASIYHHVLCYWSLVCF